MRTKIACTNIDLFKFFASTLLKHIMATLKYFFVLTLFCNLSYQYPTHIDYISKKNFTSFWYNQIVEQVTREIKPYGTTLWNLDTATSNKRLQNFIFKEFSKIIPIVHFSGKLKSKDIVKSSLNVVLVDQVETTNFQQLLLNFLDFLSNIVAPSPHPKLLIIVTGANNLKSSQILLREGWRKKFIHLTFLHSYTNQNQPPIISYNTIFDGKIVSTHLKQGSEIFPWKLKDLQGYKMRIQSKHGQYINMKFERKFHHRLIVYLPTSCMTTYLFISEYFCSVHNFTPVFQTRKLKIEPNIYLDEDVFDTKLYSTKTYSLCFEFSSTTITIPHHNRKIAESHYDCVNGFQFLSILGTILIVLKLIIRFLKLDKKNWNIVKMLTCILGFGMTSKSEFKDKIFYVTLALTSFFVSNGLMDLVTDFEIVTTVIEVENLDDLAGMNIPIYSFYSGKDVFGDHERLAQSVIQIPNRNNWDAFQCFYKLQVNNDRACVFEENFVHVSSAQIKMKFGKGLRKAGFNGPTQCRGSRFEKSSPFVEAYNKLLLKVLEAGLVRRTSMRDFVNWYYYVDFDSEDYNVVPSKESDFYWSLFMVIGLVYSLASLILLAEIFESTPSARIQNCLAELTKLPIWKTNVKSLRFQIFGRVWQFMLTIWRKNKRL